MEPLRQAFEFITRGNPVMILILIGSIVCIALIFERFLVLRRKKILPQEFLGQLSGLLKNNSVTETQALCRVSSLPLARILSAGLDHLDQGKSEMKEAMEDAARKEASFLEKRLDILGTLATVGPLLGLFGTVTGMISTFGVIRVLGVGDPMQLAGGIAEALLSTAGGLVIGIPALIFQRYFFSKVDGFMLEMEEVGRELFRLRPQSSP